MSDIAAQRTRFRQLHESGCFLLPNPWDIGGAKRLEKLGFEALATSSAAIAWALGKEDYQITLEDSLANIRLIADATALPVNADFEGGFSHDPGKIAANVSRAVEAGAAGLSIEDRQGDGLRDEAHAVECIVAAKAAGGDALLVARTEAWLVGIDNSEFAIRRLQAFAEAGADCLYAPGVTDLGAIRELVAAVAPKPLNVLLRPGMEPADIAAAGVRRISLGGALAWRAWEAFDKTAAWFAGSLDEGAMR